MESVLLESRCRMGLVASGSTPEEAGFFAFRVVK
jgi:hypothetical protein